MKNIFHISKQTKKVLLGILIIICVSLLVAYIYYDSKNKAEDPRIVQTKYMFKQYDDLMAKNKFSAALPLLDSIETILLKAPGYKESFELGIVYNNRGSAYLSMALYEVKDSIEKAKLLEFAKKNIDSGIVLYNLWFEKNSDLTEEQLLNNERKYFPENDVAFKGRNSEKILKKRVEDLMLAQNETPRRLSVCYTNLGIVQRHQYRQNDAIQSYIKAIKLWKDNFTARNNFNVLMGKPPEDRSIIDQLFPPEKNKFN